MYSYHYEGCDVFITHVCVYILVFVRSYSAPPSDHYVAQSRALRIYLLGLLVPFTHVYMHPQYPPYTICVSVFIYFGSVFPHIYTVMSLTCLCLPSGRYYGQTTTYTTTHGTWIDTLFVWQPAALLRTDSHS